jgi:hypothetical protein
MMISCSVLLRMRNVSTNRKITHFIFENLFLKIVLLRWENMVHPDTLQIAIQHTHTVCWITEVTHTHTHTHTYSEYVILTALPQQQWLSKCASILYIHCPSY